MSFRPELLAEGARIAYRGPAFEAAAHAASADVVLVGLDGTIDVQTADGQMEKVRVATVPGRVMRRYVLCAPHVVVLWVDRRDELVEALRLDQASGELRGGDAPWLREVLAAPDPLRTLGYGLQPARDPAVSQLLRALGRAGGLDRGVHELARELAVSPWGLMRALKKETGVTFRQYRLQRRLALAISAYARWGAWTPAALDAGFSSPSHFSDSFRAAFGIPATQLLQGRSFGAETEAPPSTPSYKAASLVTVRNMMRARGVDLKLLPDAPTVLGLAPGDWVPYALAAGVYAAAARLLYSGPEQVESLGRDLARDHLLGRYRTLVGEYSLDTLMAAAPRIWRLYNSRGSFEVTRPGPRAVRFTVAAYDQVMSRFLAGYVAGSVEQAVKVPVSTSRNADGLREHIDVTW